MSRSLTSAAILASARLRGVSFHDVECRSVDGKGWGLTCTRDLRSHDEMADVQTLMSIPHELILNREAVEMYAKESREFRDLYDAVGRQTQRRDVLLFLLVQLARGNPRLPPGKDVVSDPWTDYVKALPEDVFSPTQWSEPERELLAGTSLENAVSAKLLSLTGEFEYVREKSSDIPFWNSVFWEAEPRKVQDWIMLDAWYRSRCLELPLSGVSMVPYLDMVNHSSEPMAYYEEKDKEAVTLLLRPDISLKEGEEVTMSYGDNKSAAEMLFSYGFLDSSQKRGAGDLVLPLYPFPDDPLAKAKLVAFGEAPKVHVSVDAEGVTRWESPFAYLMCVNEEDGLEFRLLQDVEGNQELKVFWMDEDVTGRTGEFEELIRGHPISAVLRLRVVTVVQARLYEQYQELLHSATEFESLGLKPEVREQCVLQAEALREVEETILEKAMESMEEEKSALAADENVAAYLGSMETAKSDLVGDEASNEEDDFS